MQDAEEAEVDPSMRQVEERLRCMRVLGCRFQGFRGLGFDFNGLGVDFRGLGRLGV